jgi:hypothetical protein
MGRLLPVAPKGNNFLVSFRILTVKTKGHRPTSRLNISLKGDAQGLHLGRTDLLQEKELTVFTEARHFC